MGVFCDNKKFWSVVKPLLLNKVVSNEKVTLVKDDNTVKNNKNSASVLNEFFSNIITTLEIPHYNEMKPVSHNIGDPLIKAIIKYRLHPSIMPIKENCHSDLSFSFSQVKRDEIMKQINNLKTNKVTQSTNTPTKLIRKILIF